MRELHRLKTFAGEDVFRVVLGRIRNDRVLAVPVAARRDVVLGARVRQEIEQFFIAATVLESKERRILGWDDGDAHWS